MLLSTSLRGAGGFPIVLTAQKNTSFSEGTSTPKTTLPKKSIGNTRHELGIPRGRLPHCCVQAILVLLRTHSNLHFATLRVDSGYLFPDSRIDRHILRVAKDGTKLTVSFQSYTKYSAVLPKRGSRHLRYQSGPLRIVRALARRPAMSYAC